MADWNERFLRNTVDEFLEMRADGVPMPPAFYCNTRYEFLAKRLAMMMDMHGVTIGVLVDDELPDNIWTVPKEKIPEDQWPRKLKVTD